MTLVALYLHSTPAAGDAPPVTDYTPAILALVGVLVGALITAAVAIAGAAISARSQRRLLEAQLAHASLESNRAERRTVYSEFIDCMERWNLLILEVAHHSGHLSEEMADDPESAPGGEELKLRERQLWDRWREASGRLRLVASGDVDLMATRLFAKFQTDMAAAWDGKFEKFEPAAGGVWPIQLLAKMQADVGVTDGVEINPDTGLRALPDEDPSD